MRGSAFFEDVRQIDMMIGEHCGKSPLFFYDGSYISAAFPARYKGLRELMPDPRYVPARLAPGLGVVAITCGENRDTDVGPFRVVVIAIPLNEPYFRSNLPGRALISARWLGQVHAFVRHETVTSEVVLRGGVDFYNFPMFIAQIDYSETDEQSRCRLAEGKEDILTLSGKRIPTPRRQRIDLFQHLWMDGQPQSTQHKFNQLQYGASARRDAATLELGERHPIALELRRLLVSRKPLQYEYVRHESILFGPEHQTPLLAQRSSQAIAAALEHHQLSG